LVSQVACLEHQKKSRLFIFSSLSLSLSRQLQLYIACLHTCVCCLRLFIPYSVPHWFWKSCSMRLLFHTLSLFNVLWSIRCLKNSFIYCIHYIKWRIIGITIKLDGFASICWWNLKKIIYWTQKKVIQVGYIFFCLSPKSCVVLCISLYIYVYLSTCYLVPFEYMLLMQFWGSGSRPVSKKITFQVQYTIWKKVFSATINKRSTWKKKI
jgi:hypothetical protein